MGLPYVTVVARCVCLKNHNLTCAKHPRMPGQMINKGSLSTEISGSRNADAKGYPQAVVALAGARDHYQLPLALHEGRLLQRLVTDLYWPIDQRWFASSVGRLFHEDTVSKRYCEGLYSGDVKISGQALGAFILMSAIPRLSLNWYKGKALSEKARQVALRSNAALFCYTTCAFAAFKQNTELPQHRFLFLLQADPRTRRRILLEEIERTPIAKTSLLAEHEFSLPEDNFKELCGEPHLANGWVASSSFAAQTLAEHGIPADKIHVVPYGVDGNTFSKRPNPPPVQKTFNVAYVGKLIQSKGLSYLFEAVRLLKSKNIRLVLYVKGTIDKALLANYSDLDLEIKQGLSGKRLASELCNSDVFVFPSLAEGFGHVVLETMSCGIPVIATANTCALDVMTSGVHGFIVPIRDAEAIAEKLDWGIGHRAELYAMGEAAAAQAKLFSWERFRAGIRKAYEKMVSSAV